MRSPRSSSRIAAGALVALLSSVAAYGCGGSSSSSTASTSNGTGASSAFSADQCIGLWNSDSKRRPLSQLAARNGVATGLVGTVNDGQEHCALEFTGPVLGALWVYGVRARGGPLQTYTTYNLPGLRLMNASRISIGADGTLSTGP